MHLACISHASRMFSPHASRMSRPREDFRWTISIVCAIYQTTPYPTPTFPTPTSQQCVALQAWSYSILTYYPLLTTHYSLLTTHYSLLTTHYSLLTTHYSLLTAHCSLLITHYSLLQACSYSMPSRRPSWCSPDKDSRARCAQSDWGWGGGGVSAPRFALVGWSGQGRWGGGGGAIRGGVRQGGVGLAVPVMRPAMCS